MKSKSFGNMVQRADFPRAVPVVSHDENHRPMILPPVPRIPSGKPMILPEVRAHRGRILADGVNIEGKHVPALGPPVIPLERAQQEFNNGFFDVLLGSKGSLGLVRNFRHAETLLDAMRMPQLDGRPFAPNTPRPLGPLTIFRVGGGNITPSPAHLFRFAMHTQRLVIAYQDIPHDARLERLTQYENAHIPEGLEIYGIGCGANRLLISAPQACDSFMHAWSIMARDRHLLGIDPLRSRAPVVTNSEGSLDVVMSRRLLIDHGFPDAIGFTVASSSILNHGDMAQTIIDLLGVTYLPALRSLGRQAPEAEALLETISPAWVSEAFGKNARRGEFGYDYRPLMDMSVSGQMIPNHFSVYEARQHGIRPAMLLGAIAVRCMIEPPTKLSALRPMIEDALRTDGMVSAKSSAYGRAQLLLPRVDHASIIESPLAADYVIAAMLELREATSSRREHQHVAETASQME